jgi:hypothetical protein
MQLTGQELWQRAPQAIHLPVIRLATPRGFFCFGFVSLMEVLPFHV